MGSGFSYFPMSAYWNFLISNLGMDLDLAIPNIQILGRVGNLGMDLNLAISCAIDMDLNFCIPNVRKIFSGKLCAGEDVRFGFAITFSALEGSL